MSGMSLETPSIDREPSPVVERLQALQQIVESVDSKAALSSPDRVSCLEEKMFLLAVLRTPQRPMTEIIEILTRKSESPKISDGRRRQIAEHIVKLRSSITPNLLGTVRTLGVSKADAEDIVPPALATGQIDGALSQSFRMPPVTLISPDSLPVSPSVDPDAFRDDEGSPTKHINPRPYPSPSTIVPVFDQAGDSMGMAELPVLSEEQRRGDSVEREILVLNRGFELARAAAERWVADENNRPNFEEVLESTLDGAVEAHVKLEVQYGFPVECIRGRITGALKTAYFEALERAGDDSLGFRNALKAYVNLRARLGALLRVQSRLVPLSGENTSGLVAESRMTLQMARNVLGVFDDADRDDVEKAYLIRLQASDLHDGADAIVIGGLMRARETLLEFVEQQEEQRRQEREVADRLPAPAAKSSDDGPVEMLGVDLEPVPPQHKTDSWYIEALRRPGKILRGLFLGGALAGGAGAGAVALHEFIDDTSGVMGDVPHDYSLGVIPGLFDGVGGGLFPETKKVTPKPIDVPVDEIRLIPHGSWILKETGAMLRERGLKPTPQLTSYFSHLIEAVNAEAIAEAGGANRLPDNFPLVVTPIVEEMNSMVEKKAVEQQTSIVGVQAPEASSGVVTDLSIEKTSVTYHGRVIPTVDSPMRVMAKGEYLGKVTHGMLRAGGLNWTTARINNLNDMVWKQNLPLFEQLVKDGKMMKLKPEYIPAGVELNFSSAAEEVQRLVAAKKSAKRSK